MATVRIPISRQVRATRTAISPRLAMRILRMGTLRSSREARNLSRGRRGGQPVGAIRRRACSEVRAPARVSHVEREARRTPPRAALQSYSPVLLLPCRPVVAVGGKSHGVRPAGPFLEAQARPSRADP